MWDRIYWVEVARGREIAVEAWRVLMSRKAMLAFPFFSVCAIGLVLRFVALPALSANSMAEAALQVVIDRIPVSA